MPRSEADFLLAVIECDSAEREAIRLATHRFADACASIEGAVAHLLVLRTLLGPSVIGTLLDGEIVHLVAREVAEAKRTAHADPLTGLGNRRALDEALPTAIARAERTGKGLAIVYFDLVGLKAVNDRHGHHAGDEALRAFATALAGSSRSSDSAYRIGGDEFLALLPDTHHDDVTALVDRILASGAPSFSWGSTNTVIDGFDAERLVRVADLRMLSSRYHLALTTSGGRATEERAPVEPDVDLRHRSASAAGHH
ncbi:MAG TPA: GGDEF domain-containing protein [Acidimicrobiales bacterium]|nr:GGDEF domain-containing protein [Acidimicrobiales bacterium]